MACHFSIASIPAQNATRKQKVLLCPPTGQSIILGVKRILAAGLIRLVRRVTDVLRRAGEVRYRKLQAIGLFSERFNMSDAVRDDFRQPNDRLIQRREFYNTLFDPAAISHQLFAQAVQLADECVNFSA